MSRVRSILSWAVVGTIWLVFGALIFFLALFLLDIFVTTSDVVVFLFAGAALFAVVTFVLNIFGVNPFGLWDDADDPDVENPDTEERWDPERIATDLERERYAHAPKEGDTH